MYKPNRIYNGISNVQMYKPNRIHNGISNVQMYKPNRIYNGISNVHLCTNVCGCVQFVSLTCILIIYNIYNPKHGLQSNQYVFVIDDLLVSHIKTKHKPRKLSNVIHFTSSSVVQFD